MLVQQSNKSPVLVYDRLRETEPQPHLGRTGTTYIHTDMKDMMDFIKHMKAHTNWFQDILDTVFPQEKELPEPAVRRNKKAGKGSTRSWQETVDELTIRMAGIEKNVEKGWGWPQPSIEKYNTVVDIVLKKMGQLVNEEVDREEYRVRVQDRAEISKTNFNLLFE
tara:strand:- start:111 stop:605 length:495 start_codon:yes stop_codon:yes gene_type:complete